MDRLGKGIVTTASAMAFFAFLAFSLRADGAGHSAKLRPGTTCYANSEKNVAITIRCEHAGLGEWMGVHVRPMIVLIDGKPSPGKSVCAAGQTVPNYCKASLPPGEHVLAVKFHLGREVFTYGGMSTAGVESLDTLEARFVALEGHKYDVNVLLIGNDKWLPFVSDVTDKKHPVNNFPTSSLADVTDKQPSVYGAPTSSLPLSIHAAARDGDLAKVKALLQQNPDLVFSKADEYSGGTPLHVAAGYGRSDVAQLLLDGKAVVDAKNKNGYTPLYLAARSGHKDVVELLLANGADANANDNKERYTPLHAAEEEGYKDIAELLRQHGGHE